MRGTLTLSELEAMAYDLGVDLDKAQVRTTTKPPPAASMDILAAIIGDYGKETSAPSVNGPMSAHEMRRQLRAVGIAIGDAAEDDEDRRHTARHEAGHAATALALGWGVNWVDLARGQTKVEQPTYASRDRGALDMDAERATIAAAGAAFTGVDSRRAELEGDRFAVRSLGRTRWEEARAEAEAMAKDRRVKSLHRALTDALLASPNGRLEAGELRAVVEEWEG